MVIKSINECFKGYIYVTTDGVKTYKQLLRELHNLIIWTKLTKNSCIYFSNTYYHIFEAQFQRIQFTAASGDSVSQFVLMYENSSYYRCDTIANVVDNRSETVAPSGYDIICYY